MIDVILDSPAPVVVVSVVRVLTTSFASPHCRSTIFVLTKIVIAVFVWRYAISLLLRRVVRPVVHLNSDNCAGWTIFRCASWLQVGFELQAAAGAAADCRNGEMCWELLCTELQPAARRPPPSASPDFYLSTPISSINTATAWSLPRSVFDGISTERKVFQHCPFDWWWSESTRN